jgi:hypothetical protein
MLAEEEAHLASEELLPLGCYCCLPVVVFMDVLLPFRRSKIQ